MKIKKIELTHDVLWGDIVFDFTDYSGGIVDTVILAGENGCGKTRLLNIIYEFSNFNLNSPSSNTKRVFDVVFNPDEIQALLQQERLKDSLIEPTGEFIFTFNFNVQPGKWDRLNIEYISMQADGTCSKKTFHPSLIINNKDVSILLKSVYSTVEINYNPKATSTVTSREIDEQIEQSVKSGPDLATEIQQLLIDIQNNDANDLLVWVSQNPGIAPPKEIINRRISRFKKAFATVFDSLNFCEVKTYNGNKHVFFTKGKNEVNISDLSSGEKQIVFRGAFLLRNQQSIKGNLILIDEPEISLHPVWQEKILRFYRNLFTENACQTSQLFIATHSPFIIHSDDRCNDKVIVLNQINDKIMIDDSPEYLGVGKRKAIAQAFNTNVFNKQYNKNDIVFVEGETDEKYLNTYLEKILPSGRKYSFKWIGAYSGAKGRAINSGDSALNSLLSFLKANRGVITSRIVLLYDSDTSKVEESFDNVAVLTIPYNHDNTLYKKGIENLLSLPSEYNKDEFYVEKESGTDEYGAPKKVFRLDKTKLCNYICDDIKLDFFKNFDVLIKKIDESFSHL